MIRASIGIALLVALSGAALADETARAHYEKGTTFYDLGQYREAAREYEEAYRLKNDPALLFNIGQAYRLGNMPNEALRAYRSFLRRVPNAPNRSEIDERIRALQQLVEQEKQSAASPPTGTLSPGAAGEPPPGKPAPSSTEKPAPSSTEQPSAPVETATPAAPTPPPAIVATPTPPAPRPTQPLYKKWWLWTSVAVAAVGVGVGLGVGLSQSAVAPASSLGNFPAPFNGSYGAAFR